MPPLTAAEKAVLEVHIGRKSSGLAKHTAHLTKDAAARRDPAIAHAPHAASRHGYQSGWQAQMIRACTRLSPDQDSTPDGVRPEITEWNRETGTWAHVRAFLTQYSPVKLPYIEPPTARTYDASGAATTRTTNEQDTAPIVPAPDATVAGASGGGFISPEAQQHVLEQANSMAWKLWQWTEAEFATGGGVWRPFSRIGMVIGGRKAGYGLSFSQSPYAPAMIWQRSGVERAIKAYEERWTWLDFEGDLDPSQNHLAKKPKFDDMEALCTYLGLVAQWQKNAIVILDKEATYGKWRLVTCYPTNLDIGWAPSGPQGNARHKTSGPVWTGRVRCLKGGAHFFGRYTAPLR